MALRAALRQDEVLMSQIREPMAVRVSYYTGSSGSLVPMVEVWSQESHRGTMDWEYMPLKPVLPDGQEWTVAGTWAFSRTPTPYGCEYSGLGWPPENR